MSLSFDMPRRMTMIPGGFQGSPHYLHFFIQVSESEIEGEAVKYITCIPNKKC
jgi:hypothetical protein